MKKMTEKSLNEALAGESMAHVKYLAFAEIALKEGYRNLARLFEAIAYAEFVHAKNHARNLEIIKDTLKNLQTARDGENFEIEEMYPAYNAIAQLQGEKSAQRSINYAIQAEKIHAMLYEEAIKRISNKKDIDEEDVYICPICGYTHVGKDVPDKCPVCGYPSEKFKKF